ncbi:MAG: YfhO family protein [Planctomycetota bacterium]|jgi:hypothetical protein
MRPARGTVVSWALCVAPAVCWFLPILWRGEVVFGHDINILWVWNHHYLGEALAAGRWPEWNPHYHCGMPFLAGYQTNVCYPPAWLSALWPATAAVTLLCALHLAGTALGGWWLARRLRCGLAGAVIAGWAIGWSGFALGHLHGGHLPIVQAWMWVPLCCAAFHRLLAVRSPASIGVAALCTAGLLLAGSAQIAWMGLTVLALLAIGWSFRRAFAEWRAPAVAGVAALALGGCWAAPQLLATASLVPETGRGSDLSLQWYSQHTMKAGSFALWVAPQALGRVAPPFPEFDAEGKPLPANPDLSAPFPNNDAKTGLWWEQVATVGVMPLFLAMLACFGAPKRRWMPWAAVALFGIVGATLVGPLIDALGTPGLYLSAPFLAGGKLRAPVRWLCLPTLGLGVMAAIGLRAWVCAKPAQARRMFVGAATLSGVIVAGLIGAGTVGAASAGAPVRWAPMLFAVITAAGLVWVAWETRRLRARPAATGLVVLFGTITGLLPLVDAAVVPFPRAIGDGLFAGPESVPPLLRSEPGQWRVLRVDNGPYQNSGLKTGLEQFEGFDPLILSHFNAVVNVVTGSERPDRLVTYAQQVVEFRGRAREAPSPEALKRQQRWLDLMNVGWVWQPGAQRSPGWLLGLRNEGDGRFARTTALPRAWAPGEFRVWETPGFDGPASREVFNWVDALPRSPLESCVVEVEAGRAGSLSANRGAGVAGSVAVRAETPERIALQAEMERDGLVVLSVPWSRGWTVAVDGAEPIAPMRAYGVIMAVAVPAGAHTLEWRYRTPGLTAGLWLAALATLAAVAAMVWRRRGGPASAAAAE